MEDLVVRASESSNIMTGSFGLTDKQILRFKELVSEKETGLNKNGNKVKWTDNKNEEIEKLINIKDNPELTKTTHTYLKDKAKEVVLGCRKDISNKYLEKGTLVEDESIELLNMVLFSNYKKHEGRVYKDGFTGECDIKTKTYVRDIKSSWSVDTFPFFLEDAEQSVKDSGYDWQVRLYMMLYDVDKAYIDFCLVNTPEGLIGWENEEIHIVDHIEITKRVTTVEIERDKKLEKEILARYKECNKYFLKYVERLKNK